jgi:hypothetical protein
MRHKKAYMATDYAHGEQMVLTDLDEVGKVFAGEKIYCEQCGAEFVLWPPDEFYAHTFEKHGGTVWPAILAMWENYLYAKLLAAGVIAKPLQG